MVEEEEEEEQKPKRLRCNSRKRLYAIMNSSMLGT